VVTDTIENITHRNGRGQQNVTDRQSRLDDEQSLNMRRTATE
jgi:hypothetical protein